MNRFLHKFIIFWKIMYLSSTFQRKKIKENEVEEEDDDDNEI